MDATNPWRPRLRPPSPNRSARPGALALLLLCAGGIATAAPAPFELHASMQSKPATPSGGGYEVRSTLTPSRPTLQGGRFSIDAVAAPADACSGGGDTIFINGFDAGA